MTTEQPQTEDREPATSPSASTAPASTAPASSASATSASATGQSATSAPATATPAPLRSAVPSDAPLPPAAPPEISKAGADSPKADAPPSDPPEADSPGVDLPDDGADPSAKRLPSDRPPDVPPDPWTAFATAPERRPGRPRRAARRLGRALIHEYALVCYAGLLVAALMTWPTLRYPLHTIAQDIWDPSLQAWQLSWAGHILRTDPGQLWQANAFFPERFSFAYSDSLLGYAPFSLIGTGPNAAVLRYNIVYVLAHALLFIGGYALVRQLGAGRTGATVAALAFAYAPWRLAQEGHLNIISAGGIPLALALLARGHGWSLRYGYRPARRRLGWAVAGWLVAVWQLSLGFAIGLPFAYVMLAGIVVVGFAVGGRRVLRWVLRRTGGPVLGTRLLVVDLVGSLLFVSVGVLLAIPQFRVAHLYPGANRTRTEIDFFSPPWRSLFIGPAESRLWGSAHAVPRASLPWYPEMTLLPGFTLYALALAGLLFSVWTLRQRAYLLLGVAVSAILSLGTSFFDGRWSYLLLFGGWRVWSGIRTPGLLVLWTTLLLAILAAGAVADFVRRIESMVASRIPPWPGPWLRLATFLPALLIAVEGLGTTAHPVVPAQPAALRTVDGPMLVLPTAALGDQLALLWSTTRFQPIGNGGGGFVPPRQEQLRTATATFPDAASVQYLKDLGIHTVVLLRDRVDGTSWDRAGDVPVDALGIQREDVAGAVVFRLP